jgi:hypothetical protein
MFTRFRECAFAVFGACAKLALEVLGNHVTTALYPVTGDNMHSAALGLPAAIDIVNDALVKVGHSSLLRPMSGIDRWLPPMHNVMYGTVWKMGIQLQSTAMMEAIAAHAAAANKRPAAALASAAQSARTKKPRRSAAPPLPPATPRLTAPMLARCGQQDRPGGCTYGLRCRFRHDDANPKTDTGGASARA